MTSSPARSLVIALAEPPIGDLIHAVIVLVLVIAIGLLRVMLKDVRKLHQLEEEHDAQTEPGTEA